MDQVITIKIHITGKVQGVWFRASAKDVAMSLGLKGKIWNNPDDSVGTIAQGTQSKIDEFITWCKKGPPLAEVQNVVAEQSIDEVKYESFEITRAPNSPKGEF